MTASSAPLSAFGAPPRFLLAVILCVSSLTVMASATIAPSLPGLADHYADVPDADALVRLVLTIPGLAIAVAAPFVGWLTDRVGRKRVIVAAVLLYALAGSAGLVLDSIGALLASRVVLGLAVAGLLPSATALIADYFHGAARDRAYGTQAAFMAGGGVVFLPLGGILAEFSWRGPFLVYATALLLVPFVITVIRDAGPRASAPGEAALDAGPFPVMLAAGVFVTAFLGMAVFYALPVQLPFLLRELGAPNPWLAGAGLAINTALSAVTSLNFRHIRARLSPRAVLALAFLLIGSGYVVIALASSVTMALVGLVFCGPGLGMMFPALSTWLMGSTPARFRGRATGSMTTAVFLGQFMSPVLAQPVLVGFGLPAVFLAGAGVSVVFAVVLALLAAGDARRAGG